MINKIDSDSFNACVAMALKLWPDSQKNELTTEFKEMMSNDNFEIFVFQTESAEYAGFIQLSLRHDYVEGCLTSPVAYIEGIYVEEDYRRFGTGKKLITMAESWARANGCSEIASDCELHNTSSRDFHYASGFREIDRIICFAKKI
ncbi:MAG: GNAT family N-acetyltransferase [Calditrichae bacterium]|nr:GNAT family N-acetyltransferase [Calditrichota bacterium]MCB9059619.1 GNAT family N-acetyltransferase [Calditrichia bacterium]